MRRSGEQIRAGATALALAVATAVATAACGVSGPAVHEPIAAATVIRGTVSQPSLRTLDGLLPTASAFTTGGVGVMATRSGAIERSIDGGRTWRVIAKHAGLSNLFLLAPDVAFATTASHCADNVCEERLMRSTDGGAAWRPVGQIGRTGYTDPAALQFSSASTATFTTSTGAFRTVDGGRSWSRLELPCGRSFGGGVSFTSPAHGYALCGGDSNEHEEPKALYETDDGGQRWRLVARAFCRRARNGADMPAGTMPIFGWVEGLVARPGGRLLLPLGGTGIAVSSDGGHRWRYVDGAENDGDPYVLSLSWPAPDRIDVLTDDGEIHTVTADARGYREIYPTGVGSPEDGLIAFLTATEGVATGAENPDVAMNQIDITHDGGHTWTRESDIRGAFEPDEIVATGRRDLWVTSAPLPLGAQLREALWRSQNGGRSWRRVAIPPGLGSLSISFPTPTVGFLLTEVGEVYRSTDAGRHWERMHGPGRNLEDALFVSPTIGFVTYSGRGMGETTDGGRSFFTIRLPHDISSLGDAASLEDGKHWWIVAHMCVQHPPRGTPACGHGALLRTSDGGRHWQLILLPQFIGADSLSFANPEDGYADVSSTGIFRTTDGGVHWRLVAHPQL